MSKQRIASHLLVLGAGQIGTWIISTLTVIVTSRYLKSNGAGELAVASAIVGVLGLFISVGMDPLIVRTVARSPERARAIVSAALLVRAALAVPTLAAVYLWMHIARYPAEIRNVSYVLSLGLILSTLAGALSATLQGRDKMSRSAIGGVAFNLLDLVLCVIVVRMHGSLVSFAWVSLTGSALLLGLNLYWIWKLMPLTWRVTRRDARFVVVGGLSFWANAVFLTIYFYIDSIILQRLADATAVGNYSAASRLFSVAFFVPGIVGAATLPLLSRLGISAATDFERAARKTIHLLIAAAVPITVGLATFAQPLILTLYRESFRGAVPALVVLSLCIPFTFLSIQAANLLATRDQQWRWTWVMGASCVVNPLVNMVLIPLAAARLRDAAVGAAASLLVTESLMAAYAAVVLRSILINRIMARVVMGALVAGAAQLAVVRLTSAIMWPLPGQALGLLIYGLLAVALGVLPPDDLLMLYRVATSRLRSPRGDSGDVRAEHAPPQAS